MALPTDPALRYDYYQFIVIMKIYIIKIYIQNISMYVTEMKYIL